jgi:molybdopterin synthase catalytic subunit
MTTPAAIDIELIHGPVQPRPLSPQPTSAGGESIFLGRTRDETHDRHGSLVRLRYEAYEPLARKELADLAAEAAARYGCRAIRVHHAIGDVAPGEASVLVQVACGHREESFAACRFLIDELKQRVPIWKHEIWADGTTWSPGQAVDARKAAP